MATPQTQQLNAEQMNALLRANVVHNAVEDRQQIFTQTIANPAAAGPLTIPVRPVGLVLGFFVEVTATITNAAGATAITPTDFGGLNLFEGINFVDLNNYTRIQTESKHIAMLNTVRGRSPYMSSLFSAGNIAGSQATSGYDCPSALGPNWSPWYATPSIAGTSGTGTVKAVFYIPLAYSKNDLRGSIYAGVINATMQLVLTWAGTTKAVSVATGVDSTNALYIGQAGASITSATVVVTQHYYDQLPLIGSGQPNAGYPNLPLIDTNTAYDIKMTYLTGLSNGQDFAVPFTNYRQFLSSLLIYNDGTSSNGGRPKQNFNTTANTNYIGLQTANYYYPLKNSAQLQAGLQRNITGIDLPPGTYYFNFRDKPISTTQQGNQQIVINPANLGSTQAPYVLSYIEDFGVQAVLTQAGSLASS